jgi:hypothetical protein
MASTSYGFLSWVGDDFDPGVEHYWATTPADYGTVVSITAHAVSRLDRELTVKDVRTHVDAAGHRAMYFTVRNTGSNNVSGYGIGFSYVKQ